MAKAAMILGIIILLIGLVVAGAPQVLQSAGLNLNFSDQMLQIGGVVLVIIGLVILVKGRK